MLASLSDTDDYESVQAWLNQYCEAAGYDGWHNYGSADLSRYLSDPLKILFVGSESVGYEGVPRVPPNEYIKWIKDRQWTSRLAAVFVSMVRCSVSLLMEQRDSPLLGIGLGRENYQNSDLLLEMMRGTIYMNARITSNGTGSSAEDKARVLSDCREFAQYRRRFVEILMPRIIICAGNSARDSMFIDGGPFLASSLRSEKVFLLGEHIVVMIPHLARLSAVGGYDGLNRVARSCANAFVKTFVTECER